MKYNTVLYTSKLIPGKQADLLCIFHFTDYFSTYLSGYFMEITRKN